jgi:branched-chain amino acid transport system ATP-binding protein
VTEPLLDVRDLNVYFGESHILQGVSFAVRRGGITGLLGRNGVGKTTTLRTIMGILPARRGSIELDGRSIAGLPSDRIAKRGLGYVPEERGILATLSVYENLTLAPVVGDKGWTVERIFDAFPNLKERAKAGGTTLSGGEQQMLAIARVLRSGARTVLLDEPTEGLAPVIVERIGELIRAMKSDGITVLLVEQNVRFATGVADRHHIIVHGQVAQTLKNTEVVARERELLDMLGV